MQTVKKPLYHEGKWYFPGQPVEGAAEEKAAALDLLQNKSMKEAPENKSGYTEIDPPEDEPDDY